MRLLIKNGFVITKNSKKEEKQDIAIENGKIIEICKQIDGKFDQVIDVASKVVLPGLIDAHCHLRDPGYEYKEDLESGVKSALYGGFTKIACMPNTKPVIDNEALVSYIVKKSADIGKTKVLPIAALSKNLQGKELTEIGLLEQAGAIAFSDDGNPVNSSSFMNKALQYANTFGALVISHCEDLDLVGDGSVNESFQSTTMGLHGIPETAEDVMVYRDVRLAEYNQVPIHIAHVSTRQSVEVIRQAKKRGAKITCETCPHYFTLTETACDGFNTFAKMNPPLRTDDDVKAIKEGLADGTIDIIATDHAPHHNDEKNVPFSLAPNGIVGFESAFSLSYTHLVKEGVITLSQLVAKMSTNPAKLLKIDGGTIEVGKAADLTIVDITKNYTININDFHSKSSNSPFNGFEVFGEITSVIIDGIKEL